MAKISACVIVKDEEDNIVTWIKNIKDIVDEMIVVDTGSKDRTVEIARNAGAKVFFFAWRNDFAAAKNYAIGKADGDWIVFLDADEYFSPEAQANLRNYVEQIHGNRKIIAMDSPLNNIDVDNGNQLISSTTQTRIFRRLTKLRYAGRVHEALEFPQTKKPWQVLSSPLVIYHTGYSYSLTEKKNRRNLELLLADIEAAGGEKPEHYTYLSTTYLNLKEYDKAIHYADLAIKSKTGGLMQAYVKQYRILIKAHRGKNAPAADVQKVIDRALADMPDYPDFLWEDAMLAMDAKNFARAETDLEKILKKAADPNLYKTYETTILADLPQAKTTLALIRNLEGRIDEAVDLLFDRLAKERHKELMVNAYFEMSRDADSHKVLSAMKKLYKMPDDKQFLHKYFQKRPRDAAFLYFTEPADGSYEKFMATGKFVNAAQKAARGLANLFFEGLHYYRNDVDKPIWETLLPYIWKTPDVQGRPSALPSRTLIPLTAKFMSDVALALLALPTEKIADMTEELALLPRGMQRCIVRYFGLDDPLTAEDFDAYMTLLKELLSYGTRDMINRFARAALDFDEEKMMRAANELFQKEQMAAVLPLYAAVTVESPLVDGQFWYRLGRSLLYVGEAKAAAESFDRAIESGATENDLAGLLGLSRKIMNGGKAL